jgi:hypothetical protein
MTGSWVFAPPHDVRLRPLADVLDCREATSMASLFREHRYWVQGAFLALLVSLITFATIKLAVPPSSWHITWMVVLPLALGVAFNRGAMRWVMAPVLLIISLIATTVIGNAMGGI